MRFTVASRPAEEMLYMAMEDFRVITVAAGSRCNPFRWSCHTTWSKKSDDRAGLLPGPLRDRFGFTWSPGVLLGEESLSW